MSQSNNAKTQLGLTKKQSMRIAKVAGYIAISTVISYLIGLTVNNPSLVGPLTPIVNLVLVGVQQFIKAPEEEE